MIAFHSRRLSYLETNGGPDYSTDAVGFYPGSHPRECTNGVAATFDQARADFEAAWRVFLSKRTEADFQTWRDQEAWTAEKYRRFDRHERMPADWKPPGTNRPVPA